MKLDAFIKWFMPKEGRFQELFAEDTATLLAGARLFSSLVASASLEVRRVKLVELKGLEAQGDQITHAIMDALNSTFITPMDREDIRSLAHDIDDILDYFESVGRLLILFELADSPEPLQRFASILEAMCEQIEAGTKLIWDLSHEKEIQAALVQISVLENQGDDLYQTVIGDLFKGGTTAGPRKSGDPIELLKWKEIYDGLENACDACKDISHVLGNILVKNL